MIRVEGHSNLYRDEKTGAIVNMDTVGYRSYLESSKIAKEEKNELNNMKKDIEDIKGALKEILNRLT
tara:strand:+ start:989 stop:1189 length:201 start_codon:yes stop_codon:yes gene_type:complete